MAVFLPQPGDTVRSVGGKVLGVDGAPQMDVVRIDCARESVYVCMCKREIPCSGGGGGSQCACVCVICSPDAFAPRALTLRTNASDEQPKCSNENLWSNLGWAI